MSGVSRGLLPLVANFEGILGLTTRSLEVCGTLLPGQVPKRGRTFAKTAGSLVMQYEYFFWRFSST